LELAVPSNDCVVFRDVTFRYDTAADSLFGAPLSLHLSSGYTGVVGPNGAGKTTLLLLATGGLAPERGLVRSPGEAVYCAQRSDEPPEELTCFFAAQDAHALLLRAELELDPRWAKRWDTLSHGERKRLQIAIALWRRPRLLALDEPTNHLDNAARALLMNALREFHGVGLLVSHDRELLDGLCTRCLFLEPGGVTLRPGRYTDGRGEAERERAALAHARESVRRERERLEREVAVRRSKAALADRLRSKRGLARKDHDARGRKNLARVTGKDATAGRLLRQLEGRVRQTRGRESALRVEKVRSLGIWLPGARSQRDRVAALAAQTLRLGDGRELVVPELVVRPRDRVAITGPNGAGKTSLLQRLNAQSPVPESRRIVLPQELDAGCGRRLLDEARSLARQELGFVMSVVSCLGSRPERLLESTEPSPGELRKLLLALGMRRQPELMLLDEPTNHLDLPSIECLEEALDACPCALVVVSHDRRLIERLARTEWRIERGRLGLLPLW
jgi:ATPase subunit of ABC transporter with duplicated ATPase domains